MPASPQDFSLRRLALPAFGPSLMFGLCEGTILPVLATLGVATSLVAAIRACRQVVIPLWASHIGLDAATTSLIYGLMGAVDMLLFYPAGRVMDQRGRRAVALPSMLVMGGRRAGDGRAGFRGRLDVLALAAEAGAGMTARPAPATAGAG